MKKTGVFLALLLSLVLLLAPAVYASADYDYKANAKVFPSDYTGKTVILHSNDIHGRLNGYACMAAARSAFEAAGAEVLMVDAGDFSQGTAYVNDSEGASAVAMMNAAGYDLATLGNHEFDFGYDTLKENLEKADFTVLCANVFLAGTGETIYDPAKLVETKGGLKLGFFGLDTPETATKVNPAMTKGITFATFDDLYASAQLAVDSLKEQEADLIVGLVHLGVDEESAQNGYRSIDLYDNVTDIDFLIDGHSHTVMTAGENGEPIQSTGCYSANIGVVVIDNETKAIEDHFLLGIPGYAQDEAVAAAAKKITDEIDAEYSEVFAKTEVRLNGGKESGNRTKETNLGELIGDAMVWSVVSGGGLEEISDYRDAPVIGLINGGAIRDSIGIGDVTEQDIYTVLPFNDSINVVYVTGAELLEALEASTFCTPDAIGAYPQTSDIKWVLDTTKPYDRGDLYVLNGQESSYYGPASIQRVSIQAVNGEPFDESRVYAVVTNSFCADGGDTYNVFDRVYNEDLGFDTGVLLNDAVVAYIEEVLNGMIGEQYALPSGDASQILPS